MMLERRGAIVGLRGRQDRRQDLVELIFERVVRGVREAALGVTGTRMEVKLEAADGRRRCARGLEAQRQPTRAASDPEFFRSG